MVDVFISYSHNDNDVAEEIKEMLEKGGFSVWKDNRIVGSRDFNDDIEKAIKEAKVFLICVSQSSMESEYVKDELQAANSIHKIKFPIKINVDETLYKGIFFTTLQRPDALAYASNNFSAEELISQLNKKIQENSENPDLFAQINSLNQKGSEAFEKQDYENAAYYYRQSADYGNIEGIRMLGQFYAYGEGVDKDNTKALSYLDKIKKEDKTGIAQYAIGRIRGEANDFGEAVFWYRQSAELGYSHGMAALGDMYQDGKGVKKDENSALKWYENAANLGHIGATYALGIKAQKSGNDKMAFLYFLTAAQNGNRDSAFLLANIITKYRKHLGKIIDSTEMIELLQNNDYKDSTAASNYWIAKYQAKKIVVTLATASLSIVEKRLIHEQFQNLDAEDLVSYGEIARNNLDFVLAIKLFNLAQQQASSEALQDLGIMSLYGWGCVKSIEAAINFFKGAASVGNPRATFTLADLYEHGSENGELLPNYYLAGLYNEKTIEATEDYLVKEGAKESALRCYKIAAEQGNPFAQKRLGDIFAEGLLNVTKNEKKSFLWYKKSADNDNDYGYVQYKLAQCYEEGRGVDKDLTKAKELYEKAAKQGIEEAKKKSNELKLKQHANANRDELCPCGSGKKYKNCHGLTKLKSVAKQLPEYSEASGDFPVKFTGKARFKWADGTIYEGDWKDGKQEGQGKMMWADGTIYEGDWKDAKIEGQGKMMWAGGTIYVGGWKDWKQEGQGKHTWSYNGNKKAIYVGGWSEGKKNGEAIVTWADGSQAKEIWENGKKLSSESLC